MGGLGWHVVFLVWSLTAAAQETAMPTRSGASHLPTIAARETSIVDHGAIADSPTLATVAIQMAIDTLAEQGGGTVRLPRGTFRTGALQLRSGVGLHLDEGCVLQGSDNYLDYGRGDWLEAIFTGLDLHDVVIDGAGIIDGGDCRNPRGEEGFRGPHGLMMKRCERVLVRGVTWRRIGNWALNFYNSADVTLDHAVFRAGHDGLDAMECRDFTVRDCDFRTGDDCVAGPGNSNFVFERCLFNTSCNAFRFSCVDMVVRGCRLWGPGEFEHKISGRHNMLAAFVHFSPTDRGYQGLVPHSDRWLIEHCDIANVDRLYEYDYVKGGWMTGRPVAGLTLRDVRATGLLVPIAVLGDAEHQFGLTLERVELALRDTAPAGPVISLREFGWVRLNQVTCTGAKGELLHAERGDIVTVSS